MTITRGWDLAFAGGLSVMVVIALISQPASDTRVLGAVITLTVIGACYAGFGRRALQVTAPAAAAIAFRIVLIVGCGVAVYFLPNMATLQALAFPFLWVITVAIPGAIALSGLLAVSTGLGFVVGLGPTPDVIFQAGMIAGLSFVFAIVLGLWISRIADEGDKQRRLVAQLTVAQGELSAMHRDAGIASERERLAREIHDTIAQSLTSLVMLAQRTRRELDAVSADTAAPQATVELIEATAREALTEARSLVAAMASVRSGMPDGTSLGESVRRLAGRFERETGISVEAEGSAAALDRELEVVLLRCAQEGLANVRKHSRASLASVVIGQGDGFVTLEVRDNGVGLGAYSAERETGFGLAGMRDRVGLVGGSLEVGDAAGGGTVLRVSVPMATVLVEEEHR